MDKEIVDCRVQLSNTAEFLYAHAELNGVEIGPGDQVLIHDPLTHIEFGQQMEFTRKATISRAGLLSRLWTYCTARLELTMLYEVSFSTTRFSHTKKYPRLNAAESSSGNTTAINMNLGKREEV
jgi:hypothetical protein